MNSSDSVPFFKFKYFCERSSTAVESLLCSLIWANSGNEGNSCPCREVRPKALHTGCPGPLASEVNALTSGTPQTLIMQRQSD